ncbi:MAG: hypothetical protein ACXVCY_02745 [Pseudobdellovibrionaceae bacterium]
MTRTLLILIILLILMPKYFVHAQSNSNRLQDFTTDGCSVIADGFVTKSWEACCVQHDFEYWVGGSEADKDKADRMLEKCIGINTFPILGEIFYAGVHVGGSPFLPTTWRWGYGYVKPRGFAPRSEADQQKVDALKMKFQQNFLPDGDVDKLPIGEWFCLDPKETMAMTLEVDDESKIKGLFVNKNAQGLTQEKFSLQGVALDLLVNANQSLQGVHIWNEQSSQEAVDLNIVQNNDCIIERTGERFRYRALLMNSSHSGAFEKTLRNHKRICCEKLKNRS